MECMIVGENVDAWNLNVRGELTEGVAARPDLLKLEAQARRRRCRRPEGYAPPVALDMRRARAPSRRGRACPPRRCDGRGRTSRPRAPRARMPSPAPVA